MRKHNFPLFSIIIPTYNSQATLELTLQSVKKQTYPQNKIEILVIDGGSTDATYKIAKKYKCRIIKNSKVLQVYAKHIGYLRSKGKYIMHLDSDEVLENNNSLKLKYQTFKKNKNVRAVLASGYKTPPGYSQANYLVTEYGDAFSYFLYHNSTTYGFFEKDLRRYVFLTHYPRVIL